MENKKQLNEFRKELAEANATEALDWATKKFAGKLVFATSLGAEDQVITDIIARNKLDIPIATIDTGRLFPETYDLIADTEKRYGIHIEIFTPPRDELETFVNKYGINAFRQSLDLRHECCRIRKLVSLKRLLANKALWICGLRRTQTITRNDFSILDDDENNGLLKLSPLIDWSEEKVWEFIRFWNVPYNPLHDKSFPSIGCSCCTRAVKRTEDIRAGRWWWEVPEHRECGLQQRAAKAKELQ